MPEGAHTADGMKLDHRLVVFFVPTPTSPQVRGARLLSAKSRGRRTTCTLRRTPPSIVAEATTTPWARTKPQEMLTLSPVVWTGQVANLQIFFSNLPLLSDPMDSPSQLDLFSTETAPLLRLHPGQILLRWKLASLMASSFQCCTSLHVRSTARGDAHCMCNIWASFTRTTSCVRQLSHYQQPLQHLLPGLRPGQSSDVPATLKHLRRQLRQ